ncbi:hypothetical protein CDIK_2778, partial [Cucumispora dikerogammari]
SIISASEVQQQESEVSSDVFSFINLENQLEADIDNKKNDTLGLQEPPTTSGEVQQASEVSRRVSSFIHLEKHGEAHIDNKKNDTSIFQKSIISSTEVQQESEITSDVFPFIHLENQLETADIDNKKNDTLDLQEPTTSSSEVQQASEVSRRVSPFINVDDVNSKTGTGQVDTDRSVTKETGQEKYEKDCKKNEKKHDDKRFTSHLTLGLSIIGVVVLAIGVIEALQHYYNGDQF